VELDEAAVGLGKLGLGVVDLEVGMQNKEGVEREELRGPGHTPMHLGPFTQDGTLWLKEEVQRIGVTSPDY
jgi:hypothetical protein